MINVHPRKQFSCMQEILQAAGHEAPGRITGRDADTIMVRKRVKIGKIVSNEVHEANLRSPYKASRG